jgi:hypothetical protein
MTVAVCLLKESDGPHKLWYGQTLIIPIYCVYKILLLGQQLQTWRKYKMLRLFGTDLMKVQILLGERNTTTADNTTNKIIKQEK